MMRSPRLLVLFLLYGLLGVTAQVSAANIAKSDNKLCVLRLEGDIVEGDLSRLQAAASGVLMGVDGESSAHDTICLNSPGGSVSEGVKLAEYFYKQGVGTVVDETDECYSICAIMFMMGIAQGPEVNFVNRKLHVRGRLGFHRPYLALESDAMISARALNIVHDSAIQSIMTIMILANNQVPWSNSTMMRPDLVQNMLNHVGENLFYIDTVEKAGRYEIELFGEQPSEGLSHEQAYYACENAFHWQVGLMGQSADYGKLKSALGDGSSADQIAKLIEDNEGSRIYSVTSADAGYSEAGCLIGIRKGYLQGCGYNGMYNVMIGQGQCMLENFEERSQGIQKLASYKPSLKISDLGEQRATDDQSVVGLKVAARCAVISPITGSENEPCNGVITHNVFAEGKRTDRYEFTWPSGNKTILARDGDNFSINGKPAVLVSDDQYTLCALNTASKNKFCVKL